MSVLYSTIIVTKTVATGHRHQELFNSRLAVGCSTIILLVGVKSQDHAMGLGPHIKFDHV